VKTVFDRQDFDSGSASATGVQTSAVHQWAHQQLASVRMPEQVSAAFGGDNGNVVDPRLAESQECCNCPDAPARIRDFARIANLETLVGRHCPDRYGLHWQSDGC
jgi:hypothetical protein